MAKKALGRGLGAIFGTESVASAEAEKKIQQIINDEIVL